MHAQSGAPHEPQNWADGFCCAAPHLPQNLGPVIGGCGAAGCGAAQFECCRGSTLVAFDDTNM